MFSDYLIKENEVYNLIESIERKLKPVAELSDEKCDFKRLESVLEMNPSPELVEKLRNYNDILENEEIYIEDRKVKLSDLRKAGEFCVQCGQKLYVPEKEKPGFVYCENCGRDYVISLPYSAMEHASFLIRNLDYILKEVPEEKNDIPFLPRPFDPVLLEEKRKPREFVEKLKSYYHKARDFLKDNYQYMLAGALKLGLDAYFISKGGAAQIYLFSESLVEVLAGGCLIMGKFKLSKRAFFSMLPSLLYKIFAFV